MGLDEETETPNNPKYFEEDEGHLGSGEALPTFDQRMLWAASLTAFFGFCRSGVVTIRNGSTYDAEVHLSIRDVAVDCKAAPTMISLLRRTKTDQAWKGVKIVLGKTGRELCPVKSLLEFLKVRIGTPSLAERQSAIDEASVHRGGEAGTSECKLTGQGLCGAQLLHRSGDHGSASRVEDTTIQALGQRKNLAFLKYIRASPKHLAGMTKTLSSSNI